MSRTAPRTKIGTARAAKATPGARPAAPPPVVETADAFLDAVFAGLVDPPVHDGRTPEVVRKNRRERARRRLLDALDARGPYPLTDALRAELQRTAERWAQKDFADHFPEAEDLELRCADERAVLDAAEAGDEEGRFAAAEQIHRRLMEKRYGRVEIRGLQLSARVYQDLEEAYVPLQVHDPSARSAEKTGGKKHKDEAAEAMAMMVRAMEAPRVPATRAVAAHPRLLLVGGPGSGKSTLVAWFTTPKGRSALADEVGWRVDPVPFVVPVRSLPAEPVTLAGLAKVAGVEAWFLKSALRRGRALLLVDGLDEARTEVAGTVLPALGEILDAHPGARVVVTTRPAGENEDAPPGYARVQLTAMTREEVSTFIDRWCMAAELSLGKVRAHAEADAQAAASDLKERVRERQAIEKLAQTPLLCSVICVVHRFLGQQIPQRRVVLYEAVTNVLLYEWDRAKFPEGAAIGMLDAPAKRALLARLACAMHQAKVAELPEADVVSRFARHLPDLGRPASESKAIIAEIRDRSGVLVERAPGVFAFSHLSFQEYLTALEMVGRRKYDFLINRWRDEWWHEVIVLAAGFPGAEAARIIRGLLDKDGPAIAKGTMLAAQCLETAIDLPMALREKIEERIADRVPPSSVDDAVRLVKLGSVVVPVLLRGLERASADGKLQILVALSRLQQEPSLGAIARLLSSPDVGVLRVNTSGKQVSYTATVAQGAAYSAVNVIRATDTAFPIFLEAMSQADSSALSALYSSEGADENKAVRAQIRALVRRYEETHPTARPAAAPSPKRRARSG